MKFIPSSIRPPLSLLALVAGASVAAELLSGPSLTTLKIERGVVYQEAPLLAASGAS